MTLNAGRMLFHSLLDQGVAEHGQSGTRRWHFCFTPFLIRALLSTAALLHQADSLFHSLLDQGIAEYQLHAGLDHRRGFTPFLIRALLSTITKRGGLTKKSFTPFLITALLSTVRLLIWSRCLVSLPS